MIAAVGDRPAALRPEPRHETLPPLPAGSAVEHGPSIERPAIAPPPVVRQLDTAVDIDRHGQLSLAGRMVEAIRPTLRNPAIGRPAAIRAALARCDLAVQTLCAEQPQQDALLQTASLVLAEERVRVEMLRRCLVKVLKG